MVTAFGLAPANCDERVVGEFLVASTATTPFSRTRGSRPCSGRGTGRQLTEQWSPQPPRRAPAGLGRRGRGDGQPASASSSRA